MTVVGWAGLAIAGAALTQGTITARKASSATKRGKERSRTRANEISKAESDAIEKDKKTALTSKRKRASDVSRNLNFFSTSDAMSANAKSAVNTLTGQ